MLRIRAEQLVALAPDGPGTFLDRAAAHLARSFSTELGALDRREQIARVRALWERARAEGIRSERDVVLFAEMSLRFGEGFEHEAWARLVLDDADVPSLDERLRRLDVRGRVRLEIAERNTRLRQELFGDRPR